MEKKKHPGKGDYGYYAYEKKKRIGIVCLLFGICLGIYITGLSAWGSISRVLS